MPVALRYSRDNALQQDRSIKALSTRIRNDARFKADVKKARNWADTQGSRCCPGQPCGHDANTRLARLVDLVLRGCAPHPQYPAWGRTGSEAVATLVPAATQHARTAPGGAVLITPGFMRDFLRSNPDTAHYADDPAKVARLVRETRKEAAKHRELDKHPALDKAWLSADTGHQAASAANRLLTRADAEPATLAAMFNVICGEDDKGRRLAGELYFNAEPHIAMKQKQQHTLRHATPIQPTTAPAAKLFIPTVDALAENVMGAWEGMREQVQAGSTSTYVTVVRDLHDVLALRYSARKIDRDLVNLVVRTVARVTGLLQQDAAGRKLTPEEMRDNAYRLDVLTGNTRGRIPASVAKELKGIVAFRQGMPVQPHSCPFVQADTAVDFINAWLAASNDGELAYASRLCKCEESQANGQRLLGDLAAAERNLRAFTGRRSPFSGPHRNLQKLIDASGYKDEAVHEYPVDRFRADTYIPRWQVHNGTVELFIEADGPQHWQPISRGRSHSGFRELAETQRRDRAKASILAPQTYMRRLDKVMVSFHYKALEKDFSEQDLDRIVRRAARRGAWWIFIAPKDAPDCQIRAVDGDVDDLAVPGITSWKVKAVYA